MNSMELVRFPTRGARPPQGPAKKSPPPFCEELLGPVRNAIVRARHQLVTRQRSDGTWLGQQTGDVSLLSQYVFLLAYLEREDSERAHQCAATILHQQRSDGGWSAMSQGSADVSASVQAYFALKLTGHDPADERMRDARERIRILGGADAADFQTRNFLALLGQLSYDYCEPMPPEGLFFSGLESRLRAPMSLVWSHRPGRDVGIERSVRELFIDNPNNWPARRATERDGIVGPQIRLLINHLSLRAERWGWTPLRHRGVNRAESQLLAYLEPVQVAALSFAELAWHIIALRTIGFESDSPELNTCEDALEELVDVNEEGGFVSIRRRTGKVTDSVLAVRALVESGISPAQPAIEDGLATLCDPAATTVAHSAVDACHLIEGLRGCGTIESECDSVLPPDMDVRWDWQYADGSAEQLPDDTQKVIGNTIEKAITQLLVGQNWDGGWSASIAGSGRLMQSSEPDISGMALETLAASAKAEVQSALNRCAQYLRTNQLADGSWAKTDGTQQILCTSAAIRGLLAAGTNNCDDCIAAAANWLAVEQQPTGAWNGSTTETAWAILGLVAANRVDHPAVRRGIDYLLDAQDEDGGWNDQQNVRRAPESNHWFRNELHSTCWPLLALSRFAVAASSAQSAATNGVSLRLLAATAEI